MHPFRAGIAQAGQPDHGILLAEDGAANPEGVLMIQVPLIDAIQTALILVIIVMIARR